jgi:hypothetical protein
MAKSMNWRFWSLAAALSAGVGTVFSQVPESDPDARPTSCEAWEVQQESPSGTFNFVKIWNRARRSCGYAVIRNDSNQAVNNKMFQFYDDGLILVFTPLAGREDLATHAYYTFPIQARTIQHRVDESGNLFIQLPFAAEVSFLDRDASLQVDSTLIELAEGDVITRLPRGILLDLGVYNPPDGRSGNLPHRVHRNGPALFIDPRGTECTVSNEEVFDYQSRESPVLKASIMSRDEGLQADINGSIRSLLQARCTPDFQSELVPYYLF